jgi:nucleotide-binding universal stress UspA family protein
MFLGSFAESLLLESRTPLLLVGTRVTRVGPITTVLYPTDFGPTSEAVFPRALELVRCLSARLRIFHHAPGRHTRHEEPRMLERYAQIARSQGIEPELVLDLGDSGARSVSEAILVAARDTGLIAMAAQSGWVRSTVAGSATRQVVRGANCPVWVLHARDPERSKCDLPDGRRAAAAT